MQAFRVESLWKCLLLYRPLALLFKPITYQLIVEEAIIITVRVIKLFSFLSAHSMTGTAVSKLPIYFIQPLHEL